MIDTFKISDSLSKSFFSMMWIQPTLQLCTHNCNFIFWLQEGTWTWISGAQFEYSNWYKGRPIKSNNYNCLFLNNLPERTWYDGICTGNAMPLCMKHWVYFNKYTMSMQKWISILTTSCTGLSGIWFYFETGSFFK